jgi:hypothetical protein
MKNKLRLILQLLFLGAIGYVALRPAFDGRYLSDFEKYCPFGGIASLGSKLNQGTMACTMGEVQVALGVGLLFGALLIGKLFCSYLCPIGSIGEWLGKLGAKLKVRLRMPGFLDRPMRSLKYVLLFLTLYYTMTSSELFCKKFDPYFATANLFGNRDSVLYFAIPALAIAVLGSVFFRLFWCRYLCPLGAVSNIFLNVIGAGAVILAFVIARMAGATLSYVWLIGGLALAGLILELGFMRSFLMPLPRITRNKETCTECGVCDKHCPQGITVSKFEKITHLDCTLCADCVYSCPGQNTLSIQRKKNLLYLPPAAVVVLAALSLGASTKLDFTTLAKRWDNFNDLKKVEVYRRTGLKHVKCYGSSMALKAKLQTVEGIVGLDTYASSHTVRVYYDPSRISEKKVEASLFSPTKEQVRAITPPPPKAFSIYEVGVYKLFDAYDFLYLFHSLKKDEGIYGFETRYGEPVRVNVFFDPDKTGPSQIAQRIEAKEVQLPVNQGKGVETVKIDFKTADKGKVAGQVTLPEFRKRMFKAYDREFNDYSTHKSAQLSAFVFPMPEAAVARFRRAFGFLTSHLSADDGVVRFSTRYLDVPSGIVFFDTSMTDIEKVKKALAQPKLTVFTGNNQTKELENPFHIKTEGKVVPASELNLDDAAADDESA